MRHLADNREGREYDRDGASQTGPAEQDALACAEALLPGRDKRGDRPGDDRSDRGTQDSLDCDVAELAWKHQEPERDEHPDLGNRGQTFMEGEHGRLV